MKKIISVLLALCLLCSFVPVIGASAEEGEVSGESGIKVVYDYASQISKAGYSTVYPSASDMEEFTFDSSHGLWAYAAYSRSDVRFRNGCIIQLAESDLWVAMEVYVPKSGVYTLEQKYNTYGGYGTLDVYIIPKGNNTSYSDSLITGVSPKLSQSCDGVNSNFTPLADPARKENVQLDAGYHYVVYKANGGGAMFGNLTLNGGDGKAATCVEIPNAPEELVAGQAGELSANVYYSDTTYEENVTEGVTYTSEKGYFSFGDAGAYTTSLDAEGAEKVTASIDGITSEAKTVNFIKNGQIKIVYKIAEALRGCLVRNQNNYNSTDNAAVKEADLETLTFDKTNNLFAFAYTSGGNFGAYYFWGLYAMYGSGNVNAFEINVPKTGVYTFTQACGSGSTEGGKVNIYIIPKGDNTKFTDALLTDDKMYVNNFGCKEGLTITAENILLEKGSYYLAYKKTTSSSYVIRLGDAILTAGDKTAVVDITGVSDVTMDVTTNRTATLAPTVHLSDATSTGTYAGITYESSNSNVAAVSGNTITAVDEGEATISVKADDFTKTFKVSVTDTENSNKVVSKDSTVTVRVFAENEANNNLISVPGLEVGEINGTVLRGKTFTATAATNDETYQFLYWMDGNTKKFLSAEESYSFTATTNGSICAVFSKRDELYVDYFTSSGRKISGGVGISAPAFEKDAGYTGGKWSENESLISGISNYKLYMPQYETTDIQESAVTIDEVAYTTGKYNDSVTVTEEATEFTGWKKNGAMVSYAPKYTFHLWNVAEKLEKIFGEEKKTAPAVVLFKNGEQYMLELVNFDGIEIIEKGILIDSDAEMNIDSFGGKLRSQIIEAKQFTISTDAAYARAYVVYKDGGANGNLRVAYSDVK